MTDLAEPIARMIDATNSGNSEEFIACFTKDAYLEDWGREFHGHDGVARWNLSDNIGKRTRFLPRAVRGDDTHQIVTLEVSGDGFNGTSDIVFEVRDDLISRLIISAD